MTFFLKSISILLIVCSSVESYAAIHASDTTKKTLLVVTPLTKKKRFNKLRKKPDESAYQFEVGDKIVYKLNDNWTSEDAEIVDFKDGKIIINKALGATETIDPADLTWIQRKITGKNISSFLFLSLGVACLLSALMILLLGFNKDGLGYGFQGATIGDIALIGLGVVFQTLASLMIFKLGKEGRKDLKRFKRYNFEENKNGLDKKFDVEIKTIER